MIQTVYGDLSCETVTILKQNQVDPKLYVLSYDMLANASLLLERCGLEAVLYFELKNF